LRIESGRCGAADHTTVEQGVSAAGERMATVSQGLKRNLESSGCVLMVSIVYHRMHIERTALVDVPLQ
jgi:hypothetical protein